MNPEYVSSLANHLWQSTLFAGLGALLTLTLRNNHARVRHAVWLAASCKFLIPLSVLVAMGSHIPWRSAPETTHSSWSVVMEEVSQPFTAPVLSSPLFATAPPAASPLPAVLLGLWACGFVGITCSWWIRWRRIRAAVHAASPVRLEIPIRAISSRTALEPGIFGVFRPVLLLPEGILEQLAPDQLQAVIAHELCHVRHRDNLIAATHMFVETIFWFHPLVWWIGRRMVEERERACDEEVLRLGSEPRVYAEGILNVCKSYLSSPLPCASGVSGSDLKKRIEAIVTYRAARNLDARRRLLLIAAGAAASIGPVAVGMLGAQPSRAQSHAETTTPAFEAASVKRNPDIDDRRDRTRTIEPGRITRLDISLGELIVMAYGIKPYQISGPGWIMDRSGSDTYDVIATAGSPAPVAQVKRMLRALLADRFHLVFHRETRELPVFALLVAKGGPKIKESGDGGEPSVRPDGEGGLSFHNFSMDELAGWLAMLPSLRLPVIDRTALAGSFSFHANLFEVEKGAPPGELKRAMVGGDAASSLRAALPGQLGLKLEPQKAPLEILVIDHADRVPTAN
jgi:bla regulator protein blaR1